jgi:hypothetical protein
MNKKINLIFIVNIVIVRYLVERQLIKLLKSLNKYLLIKRRVFFRLTYAASLNILKILNLKSFL